MIDLYRFFLNPFDDEEISVEELTTYGTHHVAAMTANNEGGQLNLLIASTDTLLTALGASVSDETVKLGIQMARTQAKDDFRSGLSNELSKIHGAALAKYGRKGAAMLEIFPSGLEGFNDAADPELDGHLTALVTALGNRQTELGLDPKAQAATLAAIWASVFSAATTGRAGKGRAAEVLRAVVKGLRLQLFKNLLTLAGFFPNQEDKAHLYCPQQHLENPPPAKKTAPQT